MAAAGPGRRPAAPLTVQHFGFLSAPERALLFAAPPEVFSRDSPPELLAVALGATLYTPGSRPSLADTARRAQAIGVTSQVWCLEDSVSHEEVPAAQANVVAQLQGLHAEPDAAVPLLLVRVRSPEQVAELAAAAGTALGVLTGFVLPKIAPGQAGEEFLRAVEQASRQCGRHLYALPVLEHEHLAWRETRSEHLAGLRELFDRHRRTVLSLRVGGTDLCGLFGLRRDRDTTIWDVAVVRDALCDVVNTFGRRGDYAVSGPVWEHFQGPDRLFKSLLRATPFERGGRMPLRQQLLRDDADALLREVLLDRANGLNGKTVIHPTHVTIVNALHAVSREEHDDALTVLTARGRGGALASSSHNKMNEVGPHELWAEQLLARARAYGVLASPDAVLELLHRGRLVADTRFAARTVPVP